MSVGCRHEMEIQWTNASSSALLVRQVGSTGDSCGLATDSPGTATGIRTSERADEDPCRSLQQHHFGYDRPQTDFLSPQGVTSQLVGSSVEENGALQHIEQLVAA